MKEELRRLSGDDSEGEFTYDVHSCAYNQFHEYVREALKRTKKKKRKVRVVTLKEEATGRR